MIYLDYNATTPVDKRVFEAMAPFFCEHFGNAASSGHAIGRKAAEAVQKARGQIATLMGANPQEIVFTSGATEANNLAIKGIAAQYRSKGRHIITLKTEHPAILDSCEALEKEGRSISYLPVDEKGLVTPESVDSAIVDETVLVSIMTANNETGVIQPIAKIAETCRRRGVLFHTDAVQAIGKIPFNVDTMKVDLASLTAHKFYGPKGVGALYVRGGKPETGPRKIMDGGGQEGGMRAGTLNVPGIVGFGAAAELIHQELKDEMKRILGLRNLLEEGIQQRIEGVRLNGHPEKRVPGTVNLSFEGCLGNELVQKLTSVAASSGAACHADDISPSRVLSAMGVPRNRALGALRFSIGRYSTQEEIRLAIEYIAEAVRSARNP